MAKNYHAILEVTSSATPDEIRASYRRLARKFHPDQRTGSSEIFRQIQEAYSVLGNAGRRRQYERRISKVALKRPVKPATHPEPELLIPAQGPVDFGEISPVRSFETFH